MLEIKSSLKTIKIDDKEYKVRSPNYKDSREYNQDLEACGDDNQKKEDCLFNYLEKLGLPKDVTQSLDLQNVMQIVDYVIGQKKS